MNYEILLRDPITDRNELYTQYWSEFQAYCTFRSRSINPLGTPGHDPRYFYFTIGDFDHYHISLGVFLQGDSAISANLNLSKRIGETHHIFIKLQSVSECFRNHFEDELLFLNRPNIFIIGLEKEADISDPDNWLDQFEWLCSNLEKMHTVFFPALKVTQCYEETLFR